MSGILAVAQQAETVLKLKHTRCDTTSRNCAETQAYSLWHNKQEDFSKKSKEYLDVQTEIIYTGTMIFQQ